MQLLNNQQCQQVFGAYAVNIGDSLTTQQWTMLHEDAWERANVIGALSGGTAGLLTAVLGYQAGFTFFQVAVTGLIVGLVAHDYIFQWEYQNYELWPWN